MDNSELRALASFFLVLNLDKVIMLGNTFFKEQSFIRGITLFLGVEQASQALVFYRSYHPQIFENLKLLKVWLRPLLRRVSTLRTSRLLNPKLCSSQNDRQIYASIAQLSNFINHLLILENGISSLELHKRQLSSSHINVVESFLRFSDLKKNFFALKEQMKESFRLKAVTNKERKRIKKDGGLMEGHTTCREEGDFAPPTKADFRLHPPSTGPQEPQNSRVTEVLNHLMARYEQLVIDHKNNLAIHAILTIPKLEFYEESSNFPRVARRASSCFI